MSERPRVPVCSWPDGRVLLRVDTDKYAGGEPIAFESCPGHGYPVDFSFLFGRPGPVTLPGYLGPRKEMQGRAIACSAKLLWFAQAVGLLEGASLPAELFSAYPDRRLVVPRVLPSSFVMESVACDPENLDEASTRELVRATRLGAEVRVDGWSQEVEPEPGPGRGAVTTHFYLSDAPVIDLLGEVRASARRGRSDGQWITHSGELALFGYGDTLGEAYVDILNRADVLLSRQKETWEARLEPGNLLLNDEVFRLLGEVNPALWPMDRLVEWVSRG